MGHLRGSTPCLLGNKWNCGSTLRSSSLHECPVNSKNRKCEASQKVYFCGGGSGPLEWRATFSREVLGQSAKGTSV